MPAIKNLNKEGGIDHLITHFESIENLLLLVNSRNGKIRSKLVSTETLGILKIQNTVALVKYLKTESLTGNLWEFCVGRAVTQFLPLRSSRKDTQTKKF